MGLFDFLFGRREDEAKPEAAPQKAALNFDPEVIPELKKEHRSLVEMFVAVSQAYEAKNFGAVKSSLQDFQMALNVHLAVENSRFYAYLRKNLPRGSAELDTMNSFFDEMQEIGKVVTQFLRKYISADYTPEVQASFGQDLQAIGAALTSRIEREENTLYKLYAPM